MWTGFPFRNSSNNFVVVVVFLQEYQDDVRELLQIKDHTQKEAFLTKHTYDKFLKQVQQFFTPVWKKFGTPVLEEVMLETHFVSPVLSYGCHSCDETFFFSLIWSSIN